MAQPEGSIRAGLGRGVVGAEVGTAVRDPKDRDSSEGQTRSTQINLAVRPTLSQWNPLP